jgi:chromosomal replication initiation ATPase DnaA
MKQLLPLWPSLDGEFLVSDSNALAYNGLSAKWPDNKIIIYGSWGKSHLAKTLIDHHGYTLHDPTTPFVHHRVVWDNFPTEADSDIIFHRWNQATAMGISVCITMRKPPQQCQILPPDLHSRMCAAFSVSIKPPDQSLRQRIVTQWLHNGGVDIEPLAIRYFFVRYDSSLPQLAEYTRKLHEFALANQRRLTTRCIKDALGDCGGA